jgi:hypothetical protein
VAVVCTVGAFLAISVPVSIYFLDDLFGFTHIDENFLVFAIMLSIGIVWTLVLHTFRKKIEKAMEKRMRNNLFRKRRRKSIFKRLDNMLG